MLNELIKLSPYPVKFIPTSYPAATFNYTINEQRIEIDEKLSTNGKIYSLTHELGHAMCYKKNCICYNNKKEILCEFHAFKYSLSLLYVIGDKNTLNLCIKNIIESYYKNQGGWYKYHFAAKHIMNTALWRKCVKLVYNNEQMLLFN